MKACLQMIKFYLSFPYQAQSKRPKICFKEIKEAFRVFALNLKPMCVVYLVQPRLKDEPRLLSEWLLDFFWFFGTFRKFRLNYHPFAKANKTYVI